MKSKEEIILETLQAYIDPANRSLIQKGDSPACLYTAHKEDVTHTHCAVGRCMTEEALNRASNIVEAFDTLPDVINYNHYDDLLRPEYQGQSISFWLTLQQLHDTDGYWYPIADAPNNHLHLRYNWLKYYFPAALPRALELNLVKKP